MRFWIPHVGGWFLHKDCGEFIPAGGKRWRFCYFWFPPAWFYISKTWNVSWNVDKKWRFSIWNWDDYRDTKEKDLTK